MTGVSFTNNRMITGSAGYLDANKCTPVYTGNVDDVTGKGI